MFGYTNVMSLLTDVLLDKAVLEVREPCLKKLMNSPLAVRQSEFFAKRAPKSTGRQRLR